MARLFPDRKSAEDQTNREPIHSIAVWVRWLALVTILVALGIALRVFAAQSPINVSVWLPWLNRPTVTLYFTDPQGMYFVPIARPITASEDLPQQALQELIHGPKADTGLLSALPADTQIRSLAVREGIAFVDLSASFLANPVHGMGQAVTAVEKTLTALPEVQEVNLSIEGQPLESVIDLPATPVEATTATLYFVHGAYLVPVDYALAASTNGPRQALELYLQGPPAEGNLAGLPPGTKLLDFDFSPNNGLVRVNLAYTEAIRAMAMADPEQTRQVLTAIIFTLTEYPEVKAVMLDFEGNDQLGLGQCSSLLHTAQLRPTILNPEQTTGF